MSAVPETIDILYKCSEPPLKKCTAINTPKTLVCINCGNAYHISCAKKSKTFIYIKGYLIKCCRTNSIKLTNFDSLHNEIQELNDNLIERDEIINKLTAENNTYKQNNTTLNEELNSIKLKNNLSNDVSLSDNTTKNLNNKCKELEKKCQNLQEENKQISENSLKKYNIYDISELTENDLKSSDNLKFLLRENKLLFKLNSELEEKCVILKENINLLKSNINEQHVIANINTNKVNKSYSEALISENKKNAILCLKPNNINTAVQDIKTIISPTELNIKLNYIKQQKSGNVLINCDNEEAKQKIINSINTQTNKFQLIENIKKMPSVKIIGIDEQLSEDYSTIENFIKNKNFGNLNGVFKIQYIYNNKKTNYKTIYANCSSEIFKHLITMGRIYLEWGSYRLYEDYGLGRCSKCCAYGHSMNKCLNEHICTYCAGEHSSMNCKYKKYKKCTNCLSYNIKNKSNLNINHYAHDNINCHTYNKLKRNKISITQYDS